MNRQKSGKGGKEAIKKQKNMPYFCKESEFCVAPIKELLR